ncbi:chorismate mutase [Chryseobacterium sp. PMSZPI]|uniref:chorismate mutase n=1 Tax=Chryseobacterium sp. PMSZPI TaxID=1033900 RepID=UPI000C33D89D|nr:chorismate mutase [Chryseobacterium sp. PMSZPI]PKF75786.1 hypothetical protein CW752_01700 [Chryseobacterium sp. PMSZPI]
MNILGKKSKLNLIILSSSVLLLYNCKASSPVLEIESERAQIDKIDKKVVHLLSQRMNAAMKIGEIKKKNKIEVTQPARWNEVKNNLRKNAIESNINPDMIVKMYEVFYEESVKQQQDLQRK